MSNDYKSNIDNVILRHIGMLLAIELKGHNFSSKHIIHNYAWIDDRYYLSDASVNHNESKNDQRELVIMIVFDNEKYKYNCFPDRDMIASIEKFYNCKYCGKYYETNLVVYEFSFTKQQLTDLKLPSKDETLQELSNIADLIKSTSTKVITELTNVMKAI